MDALNFPLHRESFRYIKSALRSCSQLCWKPEHRQVVFFIGFYEELGIVSLQIHRDPTSVVATVATTGKSFEAALDAALKAMNVSLSEL